MKIGYRLATAMLCSAIFVLPCYGGGLKILTNHLGYEPAGPKHAVLRGNAEDKISGCELKDYATDRTIRAITPSAAGPVNKWKDWYFWTLDFDDVRTEGKYYIQCIANGQPARSFPFAVQKDLLERET